MRIFEAFKAFFQVLFGTQHQKSCGHKSASPTSQTADSLLLKLQEKSRLIDFLKEDITNYSNEDIGAAVRQIHHDAARVLEETLQLRPVLEQEEGDKITIENGYDAREIKLVGHVSDQGPYTGLVRHKGWKGIKISAIFQPAEIEVKK